MGRLQARLKQRLEPLTQEALLTVVQESLAAHDFARAAAGCQLLLVSLPVRVAQLLTDLGQLCTVSPACKRRLRGRRACRRCESRTRSARSAWQSTCSRPWPAPTSAWRTARATCSSTRPLACCSCHRHALLAQMLSCRGAAADRPMPCRTGSGTGLPQTTSPSCKPASCVLPRETMPRCVALPVPDSALPP